MQNVCRQTDEKIYRETLWAHTPITDFWRVGGGIAKRLENLGIKTMGDIARHSLDRWRTENIYRELGKNAELLIDHAWGIETATMADVKSYRPELKSLSSGQVLQKPTEYNDAHLIIREMADALSLDLAEKGMMTDQLVLMLGYDKESLSGRKYKGEVVSDHYGRAIPKHSRGTVNLRRFTASSKEITAAVTELFESIAEPKLLFRRLNIAACNVVYEDEIAVYERCEQLDIFTIAADQHEHEVREKSFQKERAIQQAMLKIKHRYGKNAVLRGMNYLDGGTARERNSTIGGHRA